MLRVGATAVLVWLAIFVTQAHSKPKRLVMHVTVYEGNVLGTEEDGTKKVVQRSELDLSKGNRLIVSLKNDAESRADADPDEFYTTSDTTNVALVMKYSGRGYHLAFAYYHFEPDPKKPKRMKYVYEGGGAFSGTLPMQHCNIPASYRKSVHRWMEVTVSAE